MAEAMITARSGEQAQQRVWEMEREKKKVVRERGSTPCWAPPAHGSQLNHGAKPDECIY